MSKIFVVLGLCWLTGCSLLQPRSRELALERQWAHTTYDTPYVGYRLSHQMSPLIHEDLIFQGNAVDGFSAYRRSTGAQLWKMTIANGSISGADFANDKVY